MYRNHGARGHGVHDDHCARGHGVHDDYDRRRKRETMRNTITPLQKKLTILDLILIIILLFIIGAAEFRAGELDLYYKLENPVSEYTGILATFPDEEIAKIRTELDDEDVHVHLTPSKSGTSELLLKCIQSFDPPVASSYNETITVTKTGFIYTDEYDFNGIHGVFAMLPLLCILLTGCFILWYRETRRVRYYSNRSIMDLSLAIYFAVQALALIGVLVYSLLIRSEPLQGMHLFTKNAYMMTLVCLLTLPLLFIFALVLIISNLRGRKDAKQEPFPENSKKGIRHGIMLMCFTTVLMILALTFPRSLNVNPDSITENIFHSAISGVFFYFICVMASTVILSIKSGRRVPEYTKDYIIIPNCMIREDGTLSELMKGRADRAITFYQEQIARGEIPPHLIPSGEESVGTHISAGEAVRNYLIEQGVPAKHILTETKAANILESMKLSSTVISEKDETLSKSDKSLRTRKRNKNGQPNIAFSTSDFEVFRSGIIASEAEMNIDGMGARAKWHYWPGSITREFFGLISRTWKQQILAVILIAILSIIMSNTHWVILLLP